MPNALAVPAKVSLNELDVACHFIRNGWRQS
ncbi:MAG: hypothetical protein JWP44_4433 [Mucilaginibacter sp.]|nr:hypothetical protein [Mucilaginibacter sp.]